MKRWDDAQTPIAPILNFLDSNRSPRWVDNLRPNDSYSNLTSIHTNLGLMLKARERERVNTEKEKKGRVNVFRLNEEREREMYKCGLKPLGLVWQYH